MKMSNYLSYNPEILGERYLKKNKGNIKLKIILKLYCLM